MEWFPADHIFMAKLQAFMRVSTAITNARLAPNHVGLYDFCWMNSNRMSCGFVARLLPQSRPLEAVFCYTALSLISIRSVIMSSNHPHVNLNLKSVLLALEGSMPLKLCQQSLEWARQVFRVWCLSRLMHELTRINLTTGRRMSEVLWLVLFVSRHRDLRSCY